MKATELRIGNLVEETHSGEFGKVDMVVLSIIERMSNHSYRPIPLTEEWLVRFGFEDDFDENPTKDQLTIEKNFNGRWFRILDGMWSDGIEVKYVHQLQNLYFALTGEELELKP